MIKKMLKKIQAKLFTNAIRTEIIQQNANILKELKKLKFQAVPEERFIYLNDQISKAVSASIINRETFLPYKDYCKGKSLVVCGSGATLQNYKPIDSAIHIGLNRAFLLEKVKFDFIFVQDFEGINMIQNEVINYYPDECKKLFGYQYSKPEWGWLLAKNTPESFVRKCNGKRFVTDIFYRNDLFACEFVPDIDSRAVGNFANVALDCMQFAMYMNPSKLYLVGIDCGGKYFKTYDRKEDSEEVRTAYWNTHTERTVNTWKQFKRFASIYYPDTEIISINPVGLRGIFTDWDQDVSHCN